MSKPQISIIIPTYNAESTIIEQLWALNSQEWDGSYEIIVVDNKSTDNTLGAILYVNRWIKNLHIADADEKQGAAYALNCGASLALADHLVFLDADDIVAPGWLAAMAKALEEHEFVAGRRDLKQLNRKWVLASGAEVDEGISSGFLPFAPTCNMGIHKRVHEKVKGFDESFPVLYDIDYCWRIQMAGYRLWYEPDAVIYFRLRSGLRAIWRRAWSFGREEAHLYLKYRDQGLHKHLSWKVLVKTALELAYIVVTLKIFTLSGLSKAVNTLAWRMGGLAGCYMFGVSPW